MKADNGHSWDRGPLRARPTPQARDDGRAALQGAADGVDGFDAFAESGDGLPVALEYPNRRIHR